MAFLILSLIAGLSTAAVFIINVRLFSKIFACLSTLLQVSFAALNTRKTSETVMLISEKTPKIPQNELHVYIFFVMGGGGGVL